VETGGSAGPERPTLVERAIGRVRLPYVVTAFFVGSVFGVPGVLLVRLLEWGSVTQALGQTGPSENTVLLANAVFWNTILVFVLLAIRLMRLRILAAESRLLPVLPDGERSFHRAFGRVSSTRIVVILSVCSGLLSAPQFPNLGGIISPDMKPLELGLRVIGFVLFVPIYTTLVWVYYSAIYGLWTLGRGPLALRPYYEDPMRGLRPFGSLSLSLSLVYFAVIALLNLALATGPGPAFQYLVGGLVALVPGVVFFLFPLHGVHRHMVRERDRLIGDARRRVADHVRIETAEYARNPTGGSETLLASIDVRLARMTDSLEADLAKREASALPTWPFDTSMIGRLVVIVLSVTAALISRFILITIGR